VSAVDPELAAAPAVVGLAVGVAALAPAPARVPPGRAPARGPSGPGPLTALGGALRGALGRRADPAADRRAGRAVAAAALAAAIDPLLGLTVLVAAGAAPRLARRRHERRRRAALVEELPEVVDLLALGAGAGLTVPLTVEVAARHGRGQLAAVLADVVAATRVGAALADELAAVPGRLGEEVRPVVAALVAAARDGVPLEPPLLRLAGEARAERRRAAEERARRLPMRLLLPLVGCVLPAFALLTVVPLLAGALGDLP
jgi:tight adherence protein C